MVRRTRSRDRRLDGRRAGAPVATAAQSGRGPGDRPRPRTSARDVAVAVRQAVRTPGPAGRSPCRAPTRAAGAGKEPPDWWFIRYRDPEWHLRLRIALPDAEQFGWATHHVSSWAADLRRQGLLRDLQFAAYYPETGRWGRGAALAAAEEVFTADSRALVAQFAQRSQSHPQPLAAAQFVAIASAFSGSTAGGMRWLIKHAKVRASDPLPRHLLAEAVRLADPADDWAALRATPGGEATVQPWLPRHDALTRYRAHLTGVDGIDSEAVLDSLLHVHHIRAVGIDRDDERTCLRLARAAALAWDARTNEGRA
ncbi:thiopeptide-type bacteriocin biosynthesis protein [Sphaerisporangium sp. NPDC051017]|uniref:thiopeptide-type bacteriocin biosynthesis protein n=1 Tax=Sphaerisporangium sp. NPDC051017 TaxID=3154636 RepID=UPI0034296CD4